MKMATTKHEERVKFLQNLQNPRPLTFFNRFQFRQGSTATRSYALSLDEALRRDPDSETLLRTKRMWDAGEFNDEWSEYEDIKENRKVNVSFVLFLLCLLSVSDKNQYYF